MRDHHWSTPERIYSPGGTWAPPGLHMPTPPWHFIISAEQWLKKAPRNKQIFAATLGTECGTPEQGFCPSSSTKLFVPVCWNVNYINQLSVSCSLSHPCPVWCEFLHPQLLPEQPGWVCTLQEQSRGCWGCHPGMGGHKAQKGLRRLWRCRNSPGTEPSPSQPAQPSQGAFISIQLGLCFA